MIGSILVFGCLVTLTLQKNCCQGPENILNETHCQDGGPLLELDCHGKYILNPNLDEYDEFHIVDDYLHYKQHAIDPSHYCLVNLIDEEKISALVCAEEPLFEYPTMVALRGTCMFLSIIFLTVTLAIYVALPRLHDVQGKSTMTAVIGLLGGYILLTILQFSEVEGDSCIVAGFFMYIFLMIAFVWLNIISFNIWRTTVKPDWIGTEEQWYRIYCGYGFAFPALFFTVTLIASVTEGEHLQPGIGDLSCWFKGKPESWAYFYGPIATIMLVNIVLFVMTSVHLYNELVNAPPQKLKILKYKFWLYLKLFFIMGLSWIFELLSFAFNDVHLALDYFWMVTDTINALQGLFIFVILIATRKKVLRDLANKNCCNIPYPKSWKTLQDEEALEPEDGENALENGNTTVI